jgi:hypothetical protein
MVIHPLFGRVAVLSVAAVISLYGCGNGSGGSVASPYGGDAGACISNGQVAITDDTNYTFSVSPTIQSVTVKDATNLTFNWGNLTRDFYGQALDAKQDIDLSLISLWNMTETEFTDALKRDELPLSNNLGALTSYPTGNFTSAKLLEFNSFGTTVAEADIWERFDTSTPNYAYSSDTHAFVFMAASGTVPGKNTRMLTFFKLDPSSTNTEVILNDDSAKMNYAVELDSIKPVAVPANTANLTMDWSRMKVNAIGNTYDGYQITKAVVAHYSSLTLVDLESQFLKLEELASGWWQTEALAGTSINLGTLQDSGGNSFPGIDSQGVWLVGLFCTANCNNPAPWSITVLTPC